MTSPTFVSLDVETTLNGNVDVGLAHPMHPDNHVVVYGMCTPDATTTYSDTVEFAAEIYATPKEVIFCGHNFSFDMLYMFRESIVLQVRLQESLIWDTQLAEYILTGQRSKFSSLDELSVKYGLEVKDDRIKKYFEAGLGSEHIPKEELIPYLEQDVYNTREIAMKQYKEAVAKDQLTLIKTQMAALQATTEMMFNGLHIDKEALDRYTVEVVNEYVQVKLDLEELARGHVDDINSPKQWSQFFFGGSKKIKVKEEVGVYKNGKPKFKLMEKVVKVLPFVTYTPDPDKISAKTGQISVDDDVLGDMLDHILDLKAKAIINKLLKYRELSKQLSTYVQGLSKHIIGDFIHGKLNHTSTVTGRLSSTSPNLQNISNNPIKQIFTSRWGDKGRIVEVDFNQLEVVALAHVTKDKQLIKDISGGADIHSELYKDMFGKYPTKEERKPFKARTFQLIYGAGAKAISKQAGCSLEEAKKFIEVFYSRYPQVAVWHTSFAAHVEKCARYLKDKDGVLDKVRHYVHVTETGRRFYFQEYHSDSSWSTRTYNFSPTELKNYPIQGLATGDIVPMMLGQIFQHVKRMEGVKMVNTIHDSIMFDVKEERVDDFVVWITRMLGDTHEYFHKIFKTPLALKLNAGASVGVNWYEMQEI